MLNEEIDLFVPGRICLFGEHSDYAGGYRRINSNIVPGAAIISGTNQGIYAKAKKHHHLLIVKSVNDKGELNSIEIPMEKEILLQYAQENTFFSYIAGVAYQVFTHYNVGGIIIDNYKTDLPLKKGLSSSAAISVLTVRAFNQLYDLKLSIRGEMDLAYRGEITTPSRCGRLDQGCAYGETPIKMTFDGDNLGVDEIICGEELNYVIVDLAAHKNTVKILSDINKAFPFADNKIQEVVQNYLGKINKEIIDKAIGFINSGDKQSLGKLMNYAQEQFDACVAPISPSELEAPVLHKIIYHEGLQSFILGGKGVGSQGDGSVQFLAKDAESQKELISYLKNKLSLAALALTIPKTKKIKKAVITAAGFGSRLFPITKVFRKEFLPVPDENGILKPLLLHTMEEAFDAGIEEFYIIIQRDQKHLFDAFFKENLPISLFNKLNQSNKALLKKIQAIGDRVSYLYQDEQKGLGHAVFLCKEAVGEDTFLLILGDHLFKSNVKKSSIQQILDCYEKYLGNIIGLAKTDESDVGRFGCVTGNMLEENMIEITEIKEKPTIDYAREFLRCDFLEEKKYLSVFGTYILDNKIFKYLEDYIKNNKLERNEIQLTSAIEELRKTNSLTGVILDAEKIDIGIFDEYKRIFRSEK